MQLISWMESALTATDGAIGSAALGLAVVAATWVAYFARVPSGRVPARPVGSIAAQLLGAALALWALASLASGPGAAAASALERAAVAGCAGFALLMAALFLWLLTQRKTPLGALRVRVGDRLLPFAATTSEGAAFHSDALLGRRTLLKFFRGGW